MSSENDAPSAHDRPSQENPKQKHSTWKRWAILIAGWFFIFLGILGLFLPFLQGILFLVIGLLLLAQVQEWPRRVIDKLKARYPKLGDMVEKCDQKVKGWLGLG